MMLSTTAACPVMKKHSVTGRLLVMALLLVVPGGASLSRELQPMEEHDSVSLPGVERPLYTFQDSGSSSMRWAVDGPARLVLTIRVCIPPALPATDEPRVRVLGDGHDIMEIPTTLEPDGSSHLPGSPDSAISLPSFGHVDVPDGKHILSLAFPAGFPCFLVRLEDPSIPDPPPETSTGPMNPAPPPDTASQAQEGPRLQPPAIQAPTTAEPPEPQPHLPREPLPAQLPPGPGKAPLLLGPGLGLVFPARATGASSYVGIELRRPLDRRGLKIQGRLGYYSIPVHAEFQVTDPLLGPLLLDYQYRTRVVPLETNLLYSFPSTFKYVTPFVAAGLGIYSSLRQDEHGSVPGAGLGTQLALGADIPLETGMLSANLAWNGSRKSYGNTDIDGDPIKETLASLRLSLTYVHSWEHRREGHRVDSPQEAQGED